MECLGRDRKTYVSNNMFNLQYKSQQETQDTSLDTSSRHLPQDSIISFIKCDTGHYKMNPASGNITYNINPLLGYITYKNNF